MQARTEGRRGRRREVPGADAVVEGEEDVDGHEVEKECEEGREEDGLMGLVHMVLAMGELRMTREQQGERLNRAKLPTFHRLDLPAPILLMLD